MLLESLHQLILASEAVQRMNNCQVLETSELEALFRTEREQELIVVEFTHLSHRVCLSVGEQASIDGCDTI